MAALRIIRGMTAQDQRFPTPVLPTVAMNLVKPTAPVAAIVHASTLCLRGKSASFVRHVAIDVTGTPLAGAFRAGQSFGIVPPGLDAQGRRHAVRLYSIASPSTGEDGAGCILTTTPKRLIDERRPQRPDDDPDDHRLYLGVCSNWLCDRRSGDEIMVSGPNGRGFLLPESPESWDYLFLATGTGIAPFRGMLMELRAGPAAARRIDLLMGVAYETDLLYDDFFVDAARTMPAFGYHVALSRQPSPGFTRGVYLDALLAHRVEHDAALAASLRAGTTLIYMCGLAGMQVGVFRTLARLGCADAYVEIRGTAGSDGAAGVPPAACADWDDAEIRRRVRPSARCMVEVY